MDAEHGDDQVPGPVGERILHSREPHLDPQLAGPEDHLRARVEAGDLRLGVGLEQPPRGLAGADSEVEHALRREAGSAATVAVLQLVEARDLGPHHLQVGLGVPVELRCSRYPRRLDGGQHYRPRCARPAQWRGRAAERLDSIRPHAACSAASSSRSRPHPIATRVDVSRTTSGYAMRLRAGPWSVGPCARCLGPARLELAIEAREVEQGAADDPELRSPYVGEGLLDPAPGCTTRSSLAHAGAVALPARLRRAVRDLRRLPERRRAGTPRPRARARSPLREAPRAARLSCRRRVAMPARRGPARIPRPMAVPKKRQSSARRDKRRSSRCGLGPAPQRVPAMPQPPAAASRLPDLRDLRRP